MSEKVNENHPDQSRRLIKNAVFSSLSWFLPILLTIFATPIIVKGLDYEQYGLYALILGFISYSFTFGIGRVVTKYVSEYKIQEKYSEIADIISTTFWVSLGLCLFGCLILFFSADFIVKDVLQIGSRFQDSAVKSIYIAGAGICFLMTGQVFQAVLQALHRFDRVSMLITLNGFILTAGNIVLVLLGFGYIELLLWNLLTGALNCFLQYFTAKKILPEFRIVFSINRRTAALVLKYSFGLVGYQIFANVLFIFERSWITRNLGSENLTFYVVPLTLALYLHAFISSVAVVVFPALSELRNEPDKLLKLYQRATKVIFVLVVFAVVTMICAGRIFLTLWMGADFADKSAAILTMHSLTFGIFALLVVMWQLAEGFGHPRFNALISFIWLAVSIPLMIFLVKYFENQGAAFSRLVGNAVTIPFILIGEKMFLGKIHWNFWIKSISILCAAALLTASVEIGLFYFLPVRWISLFTGAAAGFAVYALCVWFFKYFTDEEKSYLLSVISRKQV